MTSLAKLRPRSRICSIFRMVPGKIVLRITTVWRSLLVLSASPICSQIRRIYSEVEIAVGLARCSDTNEGQLRLADRFAWIAGGTQPAGLGSGSDDFADVGFNDGRLPAVDQINLCRERVDTDNFMSIIGETSRRNRPHITQTEDANFHAVFLLARMTPLSDKSADFYPHVLRTFVPLTSASQRVP